MMEFLWWILVLVGTLSYALPMVVYYVLLYKLKDSYLSEQVDSEDVRIMLVIGLIPLFNVFAISHMMQDIEHRKHLVGGDE